MKRICLYGGPGVGKSVLAAHLYADLKIELVREFVKDWAYEGRNPDAYDQVYLFAKQLQVEHRLAKAGVKAIVTDSPLMLTCVYTDLLNLSLAGGLLDIVKHFELQHVTLNFFVCRKLPYNHSGRFQSKEEAIVLDTCIKRWLSGWDTNYHCVYPGDYGHILQTCWEFLNG
jgi:hypothetical protein